MTRKTPVCFKKPPVIPDEEIIPNSETPKPSTAEDTPEEGPTTKSLLDREERAVAALLTRYKNLVSLAAMPPGDGAVKEMAAAHAFQMEVESNALVTSTPNISQLC
jgi:hypothetical protein